jgi:hypothetical protein
MDEDDKEEDAEDEDEEDDKEEDPSGSFASANGLEDEVDDMVYREYRGFL